MRSQEDLRKHYYEQSWWRWWNSSCAFSNPKRWCCESAAVNMPANLENSAVATGLEKVSFHSNPKEGQCQRMYKLPYLLSFHMLARSCSKSFKILQARLQLNVNWELPDVQAWFRKGRGPKDQVANIRWIIEKAREFQKNIYLYVVDDAKAFECVGHNKLDYSLRNGNTRPPCLLRNL